MLTLKVSISATTAIRNGRANAGSTEVPLSDDVIAQLSAAEREVLIFALGDKGLPLQKRFGGCDVPDILEASAEAVVAYLRSCVAADAALASARKVTDEQEKLARAERIAEQNAALMVFSLLPVSERVTESGGSIKCVSSPWCEEFLPGMRELRLKIEQENKLETNRLVAARDLRIELEADLRRVSVDAWVNEHGSHSQQERWKAGLLPQTELLSLARDEVFKPFEGLSRYRRLLRSDVRHHEACEAHEATFGVDGLEAASPEQFEVIKVLRQIIKNIPGAQLALRKHYVFCPEDQCPGSTYRASALVSATWHGHEISREYALDTL